MRKAFEYRLYPTRAQEKRLDAALRTCREVYNWALDDRKATYTTTGKGENYYTQRPKLKALAVRWPWNRQVYAHLLQNTLVRVDLAFKAFFRRVKAGEKPGYPRHKSADNYDSITFQEAGVAGALMDGKRLKLTKIGRVRIRLHRPIEGKMKTCTIKKRADGWYALFSCEVDHTAVPRSPDRVVGIDLGLKTYAMLSTGEAIENPRHLKAAEADLKRAQRVVSRRKKGSRRRRKAKAVLARKHLHVARVRLDWQRKLACDLVRRFDVIVVEDLNVKGLMEKRTNNRRKDRGLHRSESDTAWAQFLGVLGRKAEWAGVLVLRIPPRGTTTRCSRCGAMVPKTLRDRVHSCPACGLVLDRDLNAAYNIEQAGRAALSGRVA
jgi:putative transposase